MKLPLVALLFIAVHVCSAQASPTAEAMELARRLAGCYQLDDGPWRADSVHAGDISTTYTPLRFELTDQLLEGWAPMQSSERPMFAVRDTTHTFVHWQRLGTSPESIRISYPLPLAGIALALAPDGVDLTGTVTAFTDAVEPGKPSHVSRPVRARRIACAPAAQQPSPALH